jgi:hypothetical protein
MVCCAAAAIVATKACFSSAIGKNGLKGSLGINRMRLAWIAGLMLTAMAQAALAQGTRDPANFGSVSNAKPQTTATPPASRPTSVQNTPSNALPAGMAIQRVYRDGKLQTIVR